MGAGRPAGRRRAAARRRGHRRRHLPVQEQHRLGGQLLRLPRELPDRAGRRVLPDLRCAAAVPGHPPADLRGRQGAADAQGRDVLPLATRRAHLGRRLVGHHPQPADHQHPRRAARRRREIPPAARHRRRLQHVRDHHHAQGGHRGAGAGDDRSRGGVSRLLAGQPDPRHPRGQPRRHRPPAGAAGRRASGQRAGHPAGVLHAAPSSTCRPGSPTRRSSRSSTCGAASSTPSRARISPRWTPRSTG